MKCVQKEGEGRKGSFSGFLFFVSAGWKSIKTNFKLFRENRANVLGVCEYEKHFLTEIQENRDGTDLSSLNGLLLLAEKPFGALPEISNMK